MVIQPVLKLVIFGIVPSLAGRNIVGGFQWDKFGISTKVYAAGGNRLSIVGVMNFKIANISDGVEVNMPFVGCVRITQAGLHNHPRHEQWFYKIIGFFVEFGTKNCPDIGLLQREKTNV